MSILERIVEDTRARVRKLIKAKPIETMKITPSRKIRLSKAIKMAQHVPLIGEIKRASPSSGDIRIDVNVREVALAMIRGGAIGLSVLTEPKYFKGRLEYLREVLQVVGTPVLRKDFIVDEYQLYETAEVGANAVLLITGVLEEDLSNFIELAEKLEIEPLVEISNERELDIATSAGARLIGINNRDLKTMRVDLSRTEKLAPLAPKGATIVSESGVRTPNDIKRVLDAGSDAVLVGTALMRSNDIEKKTRSLVMAR